jgi:uncharacterized protein YneF (UPF0154 family)
LEKPGINPNWVKTLMGSLGVKPNGQKKEREMACYKVREIKAYPVRLKTHS